MYAIEHYSVQSVELKAGPVNTGCNGAVGSPQRELQTGGTEASLHYWS